MTTTLWAAIAAVSGSVVLAAVARAVLRARRKRKAHAARRARAHARCDERRAAAARRKAIRQAGGDAPRPRSSPGDEAEIAALLLDAEREEAFAARVRHHQAGNWRRYAARARRHRRRAAALQRRLDRRRARGLD